MERIRDLVKEYLLNTIQTKKNMRKRIYQLEEENKELPLSERTTEIQESWIALKTPSLLHFNKYYICIIKYFPQNVKGEGKPRPAENVKSLCTFKGSSGIWTKTKKHYCAVWTKLYKSDIFFSKMSRIPIEITTRNCYNIGINYMNQAVRLWNEIFQIVKENCSTSYEDAAPQNDLMERLLRAREERR